MCGKAETVQLLLDKGVDLSLADGRGRTALQLLEEYPSAERAREIQRIIQGGWCMCVCVDDDPLFVILSKPQDLHLANLRLRFIII